MTAESRKIAVIAAIAVVLVAAGAGYWAYQKHQHRELQKAVAVLLKDGSSMMREALGGEAAPPAADRTPFVKQVEGHAAAAERNLQALQGLDGKRDRALVDAADDYLLSVREILKRQAASHRHRLMLLESGQALRDHFGKDDRSGAWVTAAVKLKERAERDHRDYRLAVSTYIQLLDRFPASQAKVASYLEPALLIDDATLAQARRGALEIEKQATAEIERLRQLHPRR
jgi:hypothetical protein